MKVILNVDAITPPLTGIGRYALKLGETLQQCKDVDQIKLFSADHWVKDISLTASENKWLAIARRWMPFKSLALQIYANRRAKTFEKLTLNMNDFVFHSPNFVLMPFEGKSVATFHDLSFVHYRDTQPNYRLRFLDREIPKTLSQADALLTPSEYVKLEIIKHCHYPPENIYVTPLGVDAGFKPYSSTEVEATLHEYQLTYKSFVLSVATTEPRKNLQRLLLAYTQLPAAVRQSQPLVLVGSKGWLDQKLNQQISQLVRKGEIMSLGYVSQKQLRHLYAAAKLTAFPSLYEGFGLPIIESMASGTAVLTSHHSAMQEVAGGYAMLCEAASISSISGALNQALSDESWRLKVEQAGLQHAQSFSWERCAQLTVQAYKG